MPGEREFFLFRDHARSLPEIAALPKGAGPRRKYFSKTTNDHQAVGRNVLQTAIIRSMCARSTSRMPRGDPVHVQFMEMLMHVPPFQGGGGIYYGRLYRLLYRRGGPRTT